MLDIIAPKKSRAAHPSRSPRRPAQPVAPELAVPPYVGTFARAFRSPPAKPTAKKRRVEVRHSFSPTTPLAAERDIPYDFGNGQAVRLPRSRAGHVFSRFRDDQALITRRAVRPVLNVAVLGVGCLLLVGVVSQLQGVGQLLAVAGSVRGEAAGAVGQALSASSALAEADFMTSEQEFADAGEVLDQVQAELAAMGSARMAVMRYADVTGTVRSGEELLKTGQALTEAGERVSRGMGRLVARDGSLTEAISHTREDLKAADTELAVAEEALRHVASPFLPADVRDHVTLLQESVPRARAGLKLFLDRSDILLTILGAERERQYLLLFQNSHELRPTGGFIGSLALVDVDRGIVENVDVQTVYDPDGQLKDLIAPPDPLLTITGRWYLRDANWFVDWPVSASKVADFFEKEGGPTVDGVIAITPEVIRSLLKVVGPIAMPSYGVTVNADNFWEVTQHEVTYAYDPEANRPKQFLADLAPVLLQRLFESPARDSLKVLTALMNTVENKDLLLYFRDPELEGRLRAYGWAGAVPRDQQGFLTINNANIGGHKSDQFVEQDVDIRYDVRPDGDVDVALTIRRTHHGPEEAGDYQFPEGENPAEKTNVVYQRVLVPLGAELLEASGFAPEEDIPLYVVPEDQSNLTVDPDVAEWQRGQVRHASGTTIGTEAGYTFFANWLVTRPGATTVAAYHYRLPRHSSWPNVLNPAERFETFYFKQPGEARTKLRMTLRLPEGTRFIHAVPSKGITQPSERELVYQAVLRRDILFGGVFEVE